MTDEDREHLIRTVVAVEAMQPQLADIHRRLGVIERVHFKAMGAASAVTALVGFVAWILK